MSAGFEAGRAKPTAEVVIDQHYSSKVYTSGSTITGHVDIKPWRDTHFDVFEIVLTGTAATRLDYVQAFPAHSQRTFMKLRMPIPETDLPSQSVFVAGRTYTIPFNFVLPHQLTLGACNHGASPAVRDQHLRLPPSVGSWEWNDQSPEMVQIEYAVKVRAGVRTETSLERVLDSQHVIKVLPAAPEDAPLDITGNDERYQLSKAKTIRKNLFSSKVGKVNVSAIQPPAIMLSADGHLASSTLAHLNIEFAPASADTAPPKIHSVTGKVTATTFFSSFPCDHMPNFGGRTNYSTTPALSYSSTTNLFQVNVDKPAWRQQRPSNIRRDSGYSSSNLDGDASDTDEFEGRAGRRGSWGNRAKSSKKEPAAPYTHATSLDIPVTVPLSNKKLFLPTFHSCLVSRTYALQLSLSVGPNNTHVSLSVPLQIGVETAFQPQGPEELPSFEMAMAQATEADADAHLLPRMLSIPPPETLGTSLLPGYQHRGAAISVL
ncbi:arrestin [Paramyrothecium foliicola]|nr:arrestin [Paramyrothecium foliicola]